MPTNSIHSTDNIVAVPPAPRPSPLFAEADEKDAPIIAKLIAGLLPIIGFFMAELVYGRSPKRCKQIWRITLWSFLIQFLGVIFVITAFFLLAFLIGFHGYC